MSILYLEESKKHFFKHSFETRLDGLTRDLADPGPESGWVEEKIKEGKTRCDPVDSATRLTWQDPVKTRL